MISLLIYLVSIVGNLNIVIGVVALLYPIFLFFFGFILLLDNTDIKDIPGKMKKFLFPKLYIGLILLAVFIPSKRDMALMYVVPKVVDSQVIQKDFPDLYNIGMRALNASAKEIIKEEIKDTAGISDGVK